MKTYKSNVMLKKPVLVVAVIVLCLALSVTALAATGSFQGFFKDITDWKGAVVGTSYEQATEEIGMSVTVEGEKLIVLVTFADSRKVPYSEIEKLGISAYSIVDKDGNTVKDGEVEAVEIVEGQVEVGIPLDDLETGSYTLMVTAFASEKKADLPMNLNGNWECVFHK